LKKLRLGFFIAVLLLLIQVETTQAQTSLSKVIINEVLVNEPSSQTKLEWVELYNTVTSAVSPKDKNKNLQVSHNFFDFYDFFFIIKANLITVKKSIMT